MAAAVVGYIKHLHFNDSLKLTFVVPLTAVVGLVGLGLGALGAHERTKTEQRDLQVGREDLASILRKLAPVDSASVRLNAYMEYFQNLVCELDDRLPLSDFPRERDERIGAALCDIPAEFIEQSAEQQVLLSLWIEVDGDDGKRMFEVAFDATHTSKELRKFNKITVEDSWLHRTAQAIRRGAKNASPIHWVVLDQSSDDSPDLTVFRSMGYQAATTFAVEIKGDYVRLVALTKQAKKLAEPENTFLLLLWCVLTIAAHDAREAERTLAAD